MFSTLLTLVLAAAPAGPLFVTSDRCISCHNGLTAPSGEDVSFGSTWRGSMMANSARDPYWQASVRREALERPALAAVIEHECAACHMPMARFEAKVAGERAAVLAHLPLTRAASPVGLLSADGVSCSMCHQITAEGFGEKRSFSGGFAVDTTLPLGARPSFGPYAVDAGRTRVMRSTGLLEPTESVHLKESEMCATCHTLFTHALSADGEVLGELPEQVPYQEWRHSAFAETRSCQSCHMTEVEGDMAISSVVGTPRPAVSRHLFLGGNFFIPKMMNMQRDTLGVVALPQELQATSLATAAQLQDSSATVSIDSLEVADGTLRARLTVTNLTGHKLPTAYPSRRAWLRFAVRDAAGETTFESGALRADGSIEGNDNDRDPTRFEPHYRHITEAGQVQIYEPIMVDIDGAVTTVLLSGVRYAKDNRLLPDGFDKASAGPDIAVLGTAYEDDDFRGGSDQVTYAVPIGEASGPFTVVAELWYQPIGFRWAHNLHGVGAEETERFVSAFRQTSSGSAIALARALATTGGTR